MRPFVVLTLVTGVALAAMMSSFSSDDASPIGPGVAEASGETCSPALPHASGTAVQTVSTPAGTRSYRLHVPASYTGTDPMPLVLVFHGFGSNALEQEVYSGFSAKSDAGGFVVAYPEGKVAQIANTHFNAWQLPSPAEPDDVAFTNALLNALNAQLCLDQSRVYATGMSNGAMMSVRLACSLSSRIAAFAPVAGAYYPPDAQYLNPAETCPDTAVRPMIAFHGTADTTVPFNGGGLLNYRLPLDDNTPAEDVMADWAAHDGCTGARQESQIDTEVRLIQYGSCVNGALVQLYAVDGGGHTWPGSFDVPSLGYVTQQISATNLIWAFFSGYTLPDADTDRIPDAADNCPAAANFSQQNSDGNLIDLPATYAFDDKTWPNSDALGDACDTDDDNDGLADTVEGGDGPGGPDHASCPAASANTSPILRDSDGDEVLDGAECALGSDPMDFASKPVFPSAADDPDGDRLSTAFETSLGTDPNNADTDGDGLKDGIEYKGYNSNPLSTNTDGDLCPDIKEVTNVDANTATNANDLAAVAGEFNRMIPLATADFDVDKNTVINAADLALIASKVPSFCP